MPGRTDDAAHVERHLRSQATHIRHEAGEVLLHPVVLAALALLILNDHVLKQAAPSPVTGKLSDVAGLIVLPVLLVAAWELALRTGGRHGGSGRLVAGAAVVISGIGFAIVKTQPAGAEAFGLLLGAAQWLLALPMHMALAQPVPGVVAAHVLADPTDLLALPALVVAFWAATGSTGRPPRLRRPGVHPAVSPR